MCYVPKQEFGNEELGNKESVFAERDSIDGYLDPCAPDDNIFGGNENGNPFEYSLSQNYPNPFNPKTIISYSIPDDGFVTLKVFDITGRVVIQLVNQFQKSGEYSFVFDGINLPSGVYFYKIHVNNYTEIRKMLLIK